MSLLHARKRTKIKMITNKSLSLPIYSVPAIFFFSSSISVASSCLLDWGNKQVVVNYAWILNYYTYSKQSENGRNTKLTLIICHLSPKCSNWHIIAGWSFFFKKKKTLEHLLDNTRQCPRGLFFKKKIQLAMTCLMMSSILTSH